ncbi:hypothetical protein H0H87_007566 [Tephrocybe sp. NHM501043]|nr:hypothetical protein H0H87_007566 [Tephrocybe sp. NHM501043]
MPQETTKQTEVFDPMQLEEEKSTFNELAEDLKSPPTPSNDTITPEAPKLAITPIIRPRSAHIATAQPLDYQLMNNPSAHPSKAPMKKDDIGAIAEEIPDIVLLSTEYGEPANINDALSSDL